MLLRVACTIVTISYNLHTLLCVVTHQSALECVEGKHFPNETGQGYSEHQLCAQPARWELKVKKVSRCRHAGQEQEEEEHRLCCGVSCSSAVCGYCLIAAIPMGPTTGQAAILLSENKRTPNRSWSTLLFFVFFL